MTPTVEQLRAAGVGEPAIERWKRDVAAAIAGPIGDAVVRRARGLGTGERRGTATPREVAAAAGVLHPLVLRLEERVPSAKNSKKRLMIRAQLLDLKSDAAKAFYESATRQLRGQLPRHHEPIEHPVHVALTLHGPITHPWSADGDNAQSAVLDALKAAKVIADDKPRIVRKGTWEWLPAPAWSAEITITPYHGPAA